MTALNRALDYLERRRAGESSEAWSRSTIVRYRRTLREHGVDYSDVPMRSADAPTRELAEAIDRFLNYCERTAGIRDFLVVPPGGGDARSLRAEACRPPE